jgi:hypothetical protein
MLAGGLAPGAQVRARPKDGGFNGCNGLEPDGGCRIIERAQGSVAARQISSRRTDNRTQMADNPFAEFSLERAIGLRWTLRDIQARRLKMSPVSDEDQAVLKDLGLIEVRDEGPVLTQAGIVVLNG